MRAQIMARVLKGSAIEAFWAGTSFLLTSTVFQPVLGSFSHIFGRKPMIFFSIACKSFQLTRPTGD